MSSVSDRYNREVSVSVTLRCRVCREYITDMRILCDSFAIDVCEKLECHLEAQKKSAYDYSLVNDCIVDAVDYMDRIIERYYKKRIVRGWMRDYVRYERVDELEASNRRSEIERRKTYHYNWWDRETK